MSNYDPTQFNEGGPPGISAAELNKIGEGIRDAHDELHEHETKPLGVAGSHPMPTKANVGLGSVQNYPIATTEQAEAGTVNTAYMTPLRTAEAVAALTPPAPKFAAGTYVGNGRLQREINIGFEPVLLMLRHTGNDTSSSDRRVWDLWPGGGIDHNINSSSPHNTGYTSAALPRIIGDKLIVGGTSSGTYGNVSGVTYHWFAWGVAE